MRRDGWGQEGDGWLEQWQEQLVAWGFQEEVDEMTEEALFGVGE